MRIPKAIPFLFFMLLATSALPQISWNFAQQNMEPFIMNASAAGLKPCITVTMGHRRQWTTVPQLVFTNSASFNVSTRKEGVDKFKKGWHGYGGSILDDRQGIFRSFLISGAYAYHLVIGDNKYLSFGTYASLSRMVITTRNVTTKQPDDPAFQNAAPIYFFPIVSPGISYTTPTFYAGISTWNITQRKADMYGNSWGTPADLKTMVYANAMKTFVYDEYNHIHAGIQLFYEGYMPPSIDLQAGWSFHDQVTGIAGYRLQDAIMGMIQVRFKSKLRVGYAYEYNISKMGSFAQHTHEIILTFNSCFSDEGFDPKLYCPAYAKHQVPSN